MRLASLLVLLLPALAAGQAFTLTTYDGSKVRGTLVGDVLSIATPYGTLQVPASDCLAVEFGGRLNAKAQADVKDLGDKDHKTREAASKRIALLGPAAWPVVNKLALEEPDPEAKRRLELAAKALADRHPGATLLHPHDTFRLRGGAVIHGTLAATELHLVSDAFGKLPVAVERIQSLVASSDATITVPADDGWTASGIHVSPGQRVRITAEGQVDLFPQQPGQYVSGPKGYTMHGRNGAAWMAGTLLVRAGNEPAQVVGESLVWTFQRHEQLMFHVVPSPWQNASSGAFRCTIKVE
jgi:hypothetical protein